jgi:hypothetical protein
MKLSYLTAEAMVSTILIAIKNAQKQFLVKLAVHLEPKQLLQSFLLLDGLAFVTERQLW